MWRKTYNFGRKRRSVKWKGGPEFEGKGKLKISFDM